MTCVSRTFLTVLVLFLTSSVALSQTIDTVAGGLSGDLDPLNTSAGTPSDVAVDASGNLFYNGFALVFRLDVPTGVLRRFAGAIEFFGQDDGIMAIDAGVDALGIGFDAVGNLYVTEDEGRVRKIDASGIITTVAGGVGFEFSGDGGPAVGAGLNTPKDVAFDSLGNMYIADSQNLRIRKVDLSGIITTFAGNGVETFGGDGGPATSASLNFPSGVAVDTLDNVYIADTVNNRVRKVDPFGIITTVAGDGSPAFAGDGGPATAASLNFPRRVEFDTAGNLYIADSSNNRIRKVDSGGIISTVAGNGLAEFSGDSGPATLAGLNSPAGVAIDGAGNVYIADPNNSRIRIVDTSGIITTVVGSGSLFSSGDGGPAVSASVFDPWDVVTAPAGSVFLTERDFDLEGNRVRKVNASGDITTIAGTGLAGFSGDGGAATAARLNFPTGLAIDSAGSVYIADAFNSRLRKIDSGGIITTVAGDGTFGFGGDGGPAVAASLNFPQGVAVDATGQLYIADSGNFRVRMVDVFGDITTVAGSGIDGFSGDGGPATAAAVSSFSGIAVDTAGNLYIGDSGNRRVRRVDTSGTITTVGGDGNPGSSGDGGPATSASLTPTDVIVESSGNLYVMDASNNRIRKIDTAGVITTVAGDGNAGFSPDGTLALNAHLGFPLGGDVDSQGNIFFTEALSDRIRVIRPPASDVDGDGIADLDDICPADPLDMCIVGGSTASAIEAATGGSLTTPDGNLNLDIGANDLSEDTVISATQFTAGQGNVDVLVGDTNVQGSALVTYDLEPDGLQFAQPVTLTIVVDLSTQNPPLTQTQLDSLKVYLRNDTTGVFEPITPDPSDCSVVAIVATCQVDVTGFSTFAVIALPETPAETIQRQIDVLQALIDADPGSLLATKAEDAASKAATSLTELAKIPPDNQAALGNIEGAVGDLQAAVGLAPAQDSVLVDVMDALVGAARRLAAEAVGQAVAQGADADVLSDAQQALAEGDSLRDMEAFKPAFPI